MAVDKKAREALDSAVSAHFDTIPEIPRVNLKDKAKRRASNRKRIGLRASWDISPEIKDVIEGLADELGTSQSQAASYLIAAGLIAINKGVVAHPANNKQQSKALKFEYDLQIPPIEKISGIKRHR